MIADQSLISLSQYCTVMSHIVDLFVFYSTGLSLIRMESDELEPFSVFVLHHNTSLNVRLCMSEQESRFVLQVTVARSARSRWNVLSPCGLCICVYAHVFMRCLWMRVCVMCEC